MFPYCVKRKVLLELVFAIGTIVFCVLHEEIYSDYDRVTKSLTGICFAGSLTNIISTESRKDLILFERAESVHRVFQGTNFRAIFFCGNLFYFFMATCRLNRAIVNHLPWLNIVISSVLFILLAPRGGKGVGMRADTLRNLPRAYRRARNCGEIVKLVSEEFPCQTWH